MDRNKYFKIAQEFIGIPYCHGGRDMKGLDCLGLVYLFYNKVGINIPDNDGKEYSLEWYKKDPERLLRGIQQVGKEVAIHSEPLQPLDLVYFRIGGAITHAGIMLDKDCFIHVMIGQLIHITRFSPAWKRRLQGARRLI
ncbi:MAG TPA: glycoside hydrolase [Firmicutes bacterium]|jgi:cell wall-associated NlpC family hydrolase|nr:glycoside hydrolase [Bacillota bacterium]